MFRNLILKNRSYRRFFQHESVSMELLRELVDYARLSPSAANLQELKYILSNEPQKNECIFSSLSWAGYLPEWNGPVEGEKPSAYIVILGDTSIKKKFTVNHGIALQSILLGAAEKGLGGCTFGSIDRIKLRAQLSIADHFEILLVIAIGKPREDVVIEEVGEDGSIKYWRDDQQRHYVPKRKLDDIIIREFSLH